MGEPGCVVVGSWNGLQHGLNSLGGNGELVLLAFIDVLKEQGAPVLKGGGREVWRGIGKVGRWTVIGYGSDVSPYNQESTTGPGLWEKGHRIAKITMQVISDSGYHGAQIPHRRAAIEAWNVFQD